MKTVNYEEYRKELNKLNWKILKMSDKGSGCWSSLGALTNVNSEVPKKDGELYLTDEVELGINWCACGIVNLARANKYADEFKKVLEMAKNFKYNGYRITY